MVPSYLEGQEAMMKVEIVEGPVSAGAVSKPKYRTARSDGASIRVRIVDADSPSFGADFEAAFKANVRRARRENRLLKAQG
jgi:hypothetical protein